MTIHLIKLSVGSESIESLKAWQEHRLAERKKSGQPVELWHRTRMFPRRRDELLDGGSIFWVIKGAVLVRQKLIELRPVRDHDGIQKCDLIYDPELIAVRPHPRRAFQGWRYLNVEDAPDDLAGHWSVEQGMPATMREELMELGLI